MRPYKEICEDRDLYWNQYQCAPAPFARYCPIINSHCVGDKRKVVARPARVIIYSLQAIKIWLTRVPFIMYIHCSPCKDVEKQNGGRVNKTTLQKEMLVSFPPLTFLLRNEEAPNTKLGGPGLEIVHEFWFIS